MALELRQSGDIRRPEMIPSGPSAPPLQGGVSQNTTIQKVRPPGQDLPLNSSSPNSPPKLSSTPPSTEQPALASPSPPSASVLSPVGASPPAAAPGWSERALSALGMLGVYGRGTTVVPPANLLSDYDVTYPHKLFGIFRNTDTTKLTPEEEITLKVVVPGGMYMIQVENHDLISGPALSLSLQVAACDEQGNLTDELLHDSECAKIASKASPMDRSDHDVRFEVPSGTHGLVYVVVKNTGAWRGCKGSLLLRGSYDHFRMLDPRPAKEELTHLERSLMWFNSEFQPRLLRGEIFIAVLSPVVNTQRRRRVIGTLFLTNYQLIFAPNPSADPSVPVKASDPRVRSIPLGHIYRIEWTDGESFSFKLHLRSFACAKIKTLALAPYGTNLKGKDPRQQLKDLLYSSAFPESLGSLFTFAHGAEVNKDANVLLGWSKYDALQEYERLGISTSKDWRVSEINGTYELCETYPRLLAVPAVVSDEQLRAVAAFRSRGRIPVAVWRHPATGAVLLRCSQPLTGISGAKCADDVAFFDTVRTVNTHCSSTLYIFDARPRVNAVGNSLMGKGYEDMNVYKNCRLQFLNIDNIQVMSASLRRLRDAVLSPDFVQKDPQQLDWLFHLERLLQGTDEIVKALDEVGASVVTHCSDGWDRTAQLTSLVQICLDPHFRTLNGFALLIEKEWLSFGHQFGKRIGYGEVPEEGYWDSLVGEKGPIFLQFIDCVYQLCLQHPTAFAFNDTFLRFVLFHLYSLRFGTFLLNSDKERKQIDLARRTCSIWSLVDDPVCAREWANPAYDPGLGKLGCTQKPKLWTNYYLPSNAHAY